MEFKNDSITITDETIINYYKENPTLDIVTMNHILIDIIRKLSSNLSETMNATMNARILSVVSNIEKNMSIMKNEFNEKIYDTKKEYIENVKIVLSNNTLTIQEKINTIIEKTTDNILTKTTLLINDVIPKSNDKIYSQIEGCVRLGISAIERDTKQILETTNKDDNKSKEIINTIENHFTKMITNIQQPIFSFIQSSEERTHTGIKHINDNVQSQHIFQEKLTTELNDFLNKYKHNASIKGNISETELYHMIQHIMPFDEILNVSSETASCDFRVNRKHPNKPSILFENKDYGRNVTTEEVSKFERDLQTQQLHGIFLSQKTPITYKENFQIDIINGLIHVYIPNAEYNTDKLKIAIDLIDNLSNKLETIKNASTTSEKCYSINQEDMNELAEEFRNFGVQKLAIQEHVKQMNKVLLDKLEELQLPKIKKVLIKLGNIENDEEFRCCHCNEWTGKNRASLSAHTRNCKSNPKNKEAAIVQETISIENTDGPIIQNKPVTKKIKKDKTITPSI